MMDYERRSRLDQVPAAIVGRAQTDPWIRANVERWLRGGFDTIEDMLVAMVVNVSDEARRYEQIATEAVTHQRTVYFADAPRPESDRAQFSGVRPIA